MIWIKTSHEPLFGNHIKIPELGGPVEFNENGKANVTEQTADIISKEIEHIEKCTSDSEEEDKDDDSKITEDSDE